MRNKRAYCPTCKETVAFRTSNRQDQRQRDGKSFRFRKPVAICPECGSELDYEPYVQAAHDAFERACSTDTGLITPEQIRELPRKYAMGKRPLSRLLGWGELTYTRLLEGNIPTPEHSAELLELLDDPAAFAQLLQRGYERGTITETAYKRSMRAVNRMLGAEANAAKRVSAAADRLCVLAEGNLTPSALQSLLYYVHGYSITTFNRPLFQIQPVAAPNGPEYVHIRKGYTFDDIQATYEHAKANAASYEQAEGAVEAFDEPNDTKSFDKPDKMHVDEAPESPIEADSVASEPVSEAEAIPALTRASVDLLFQKAEAIKAKKGKKSKKWKKALKAAEEAEELLRLQEEALKNQVMTIEGPGNVADEVPEIDAEVIAEQPDQPVIDESEDTQPQPNQIIDSTPSALAGLISVLNEPEKALIDKVYAHYGQMSGQVLARLARSEQPWTQTRAQAAENGENPDTATITAEAIRSYFIDLANRS